MHQDFSKIHIYPISSNLLLTFIFCLSVIFSYGQNIGINPTGAAPNASAMLDVNASPGNNKGLLIPRMTDAQRQGLLSPATGLLIFNTTNAALDLYNGTGWQKISTTQVSTTSATGIVSVPGVAINTSGQLPDPSAMLDVSSTTKGMLIPRLTAPGLVTTPVTGLIIYNSTSGSISYYNGTVWVSPCQSYIDNNYVHTAATAEGVAINTSGAAANPSAMLDVSSSNQGILIPPLKSSERAALPTPAPGLFIYNTDDKDIEYWTGSAWNELASGVLTATATASPIPVCAGSQLTLTGTAAGGTSWKWTGPNGFTSYSQDTIITGGKLAAGTYTLNVNSSCPATTAAVTVNDSVHAAASPDTLCAGTPIDFTGYAPGATTWNWVGPHGFASSSQNPTLNTTAGSGAALGTYTLSTNNGCGPTTIHVLVDSVVPQNVTATGIPNPACAGSTVLIKGSATEDPNFWIWQWSWPQFPFVIGFVAADTFSISGVLVQWGVTYTLDNAYNVCGASALGASFNLTVDTIPNPPTASTNTPSTTQIVWNWNASAGATGYQWNTTNTYPGVGVNTVASPTYTQPSLTCGTSYTLYIWAYNQCGYSTPATALTQNTSGCPTCGTQVWAAANLDVGTFESTGISNPMGAGKKWCYNDVPANCLTYGALYEWSNATGLAPGGGSGAGSTCDPCGTGGIQGICPANYHIPTDLEWSRYEYCVESTIAPVGATSLSTFQTSILARGSTSATAGVYQGAGAKMKETTTQGGTWADGAYSNNLSGFSALPGGHYQIGFGSTVLGTEADIWSATEQSTNIASYQIFYQNSPQVTRGGGSDENVGISVRCIHN